MSASGSPPAGLAPEGELDEYRYFCASSCCSGNPALTGAEVQDLPSLWLSDGTLTDPYTEWLRTYTSEGLGDYFGGASLDIAISPETTDPQANPDMDGVKRAELSAKPDESKGIVREVFPPNLTPNRGEKKRPTPADEDDVALRPQPNQPPQNVRPTEAQRELPAAKRQKLTKARELFFPDNPSKSLTDEEVNSLALLSKISKEEIRLFLSHEAALRTQNPTAHGPSASGSSRRAQDRLSATAQSPEDEHNQHLVNEYIRRATLKGCNPGQRTRNNVGPFCCTSKCGYRTKRRDDFTRHEEIRQPQQIWCCQLCVASGQHPFITHRKDKFVGHISSAHKAFLVDQTRGVESEIKNVICGIQNESRVAYQATFKPTCGFCGQLQGCWEDRNKHIIGHFKGSLPGGPKVIEEWRDPWTEPEDGEDLDSDNGHDDDDDDGDSSNDDDDGSSPDGQYDGRRDPGCGGPDDCPNGGSASLDPFLNYPGLGQGGISDFSNQYTGSTLSNNAAETVNLPLRLLQPSGALGKGAFATVEKVVDDVTKLEFARKRIPTPKPDHVAKQRFELEVRIMEKLDHPNIVKIEDHWRDQSSMNILMSPAAESNLKTILSTTCPWVRRKMLENMWWWIWLENLASALSYMHTQKVRHGDVKPANIVVHNSQVYFCDFGISRLVKTKSTSSSQPPMTPLYAAPEVFSRKKHGRAADVFSLGCVFLELVTVHRLGTLSGLYAYLRDASKTKKQKPSYQSQLYEVMKWIALLEEHTDGETARVLHMCRLMLQPRASERPTASQVKDALSEVSSPTPKSAPRRDLSRGQSLAVYQWECREDECGMSQLWQQCRLNAPANQNPLGMLVPENFGLLEQSLRGTVERYPFSQPTSADPTKPWTWKDQNDSCSNTSPVRRRLDCDLLGAGSSTDSLLPSYDAYAASLSLTQSQQQRAEQSLLDRLWHDAASSGEDPRARWFNSMSMTTPYERVNSPAAEHRAKQRPQLALQIKDARDHYDSNGPDEPHLVRASPLIEISEPGADETTSHRSFTGVIDRVRGFVEKRVEKRRSAVSLRATGPGHLSPRSVPDDSLHSMGMHLASPVPDRCCAQTASGASTPASPSPIHAAGKRGETSTIPSALNPQAPEFTPRDGKSSGPGSSSSPAMSRQSSASGRSVHSDFTHCGRHSNAWLFNNWSVRGAARGFWGKGRRARGGG